MKRIVLFFVSVLSVAICFAQEDNLRKKYINLGFVNTTMSQNGMSDLKSKFGVSYTVGRTFYLHKKPIGRVLRFGLDATWFDLNYTNYSTKHISDGEEDNYQYYQGDISAHIGPSVIISPVRNLKIHSYFRYAPSLSAIFTEDKEDKKLYQNYATFFVGGVCVSYGFIGFGFESRFGNCKYKESSLLGEIGKEFLPNEDSSSGLDFAVRNKIKHTGWRAYLTFRF